MNTENAKRLISQFSIKTVNIYSHI